MRASKRDVIVEASIQLFLEKGYHATTTLEIAQRAGVNEVTLFRNFGTKFGILEEIIRARSNYVERISKVIQNSRYIDMESDLLSIAKIYHEAVMENIIFIIAIANEIGSDLHKSMSIIPKNLVKAITEYFHNFSRKNGIQLDAEYLSMQFISLNFGSIFYTKVVDNNESMSAMKLEKIVKTFVNGIPLN